MKALGLHEFVGAIIRLANWRYAALSGEGLAGKMHAFYDEVLQHLHGIVDNADSLPEALPVRMVLDNHATHIEQVYNCFKKKDRADGLMCPRAKYMDRTMRYMDRTMSVDEFETFCREAGVTPEILHVNDPRAIFVALNLDDDLYEQVSFQRKNPDFLFSRILISCCKMLIL